MLGKECKGSPDLRFTSSGTAQKGSSIKKTGPCGPVFILVQSAGRLLAVRMIFDVSSEKLELCSLFAAAATVVLLAAIGSGLLVRRRLDRLDLIGVLKTKE